MKLGKTKLIELSWKYCIAYVLFVLSKTVLSVCSLSITALYSVSKTYRPLVAMSAALVLRSPDQSCEFHVSQAFYFEVFFSALHDNIYMYFLINCRMFMN